jgi:hypothetical protein
MGKHTDASDNTNPRNTDTYKPKHEKEEKIAGSDLPARDAGLKRTIIKKFTK